MRLDEWAITPLDLASLGFFSLALAAARAHFVGLRDRASGASSRYSRPVLVMRCTKIYFRVGQLLDRWFFVKRNIRKILLITSSILLCNLGTVFSLFNLVRSRDLVGV